MLKFLTFLWATLDLLFVCKSHVWAVHIHSACARVTVAMSIKESGPGDNHVMKHVRLSVTELAATYLGLYKVPLDFFWHFHDMYCAGFVENTLFKSSGNFYWWFLTTSQWIRDGDRFISSRLAYRYSNSSYNWTESSLVTVGYQLRFLALLHPTRSADLACTGTIA